MWVITVRKIRIRNMTWNVHDYILSRVQRLLLHDVSHFKKQMFDFHLQLKLHSLIFYFYVCQ